MLNWTDERLNRLFAATTKGFGVVILLVGRFLHVTITTVCMDSPKVSNGKYTFGSSCIPMTTKYATLIHEMRMRQPVFHGRLWRKEMVRLKREGAPTSPLDFLTPYSCRNIVIDFIEAAPAGDSWLGALSELGKLHELCDFSRTPVNARAAHILKQARTLFEVGLTDLKNNLCRCQKPRSLIIPS